MEAEKPYPVRSRATMQLFSGGAFDMLNPRPEDITLADAAHHIARINRYTGAIDAPYYSVAQHSWLCAVAARLVHPDQEMSLILHDVPEAIIGDEASPRKQYMRAKGAGPVLDELDREVTKAVHARLGYGLKVNKAVLHAIDLWALNVERWSFMRPSSEPIWADKEIQSVIDGGLDKGAQTALASTFAKKLKPWPPSVAERMFLEAYRDTCLRTPGASQGVYEADAALAALEGRTLAELNHAEKEQASADVGGWGVDYYQVAPSSLKTTFEMASSRRREMDEKLAFLQQMHDEMKGKESVAHDTYVNAISDIYPWAHKLSSALSYEDLDKRMFQAALLTPKSAPKINGAS